MYAIAKSGGKQFKIEQNAVIRVPSLSAGVGDKVRLDEILLVSEDGSVIVGRPMVEGAFAEARVVRHGRGEKIRMIKYKRRKNYRRTIGHRQNFTELMIDGITLGASPAVEKKTARKSAKAKPAPEAAAAQPEQQQTAE